MLNVEMAEKLIKAAWYENRDSPPDKFVVVADVDNLRNYLGRSPGHVDASKPDEIENPKLQLRHLLGERVYTARVSAEIAGMLDATAIVQRSPSFRTFVDAVMNGSGDVVPPPATGDNA